jgi:hypothetical protein
MFRIVPLVILLILSCVSVAQDLDPSLAPQATQYTADLETLKTARKALLAESTRNYLLQLDAALKAPELDAAAATTLKKEREGVATGLLVPAHPTGLPADILAARKAFFSGVGKAAHDFATGKKKIDDSYLKVLTALARKAKAKTAPAGLAAQVAAERRRVMGR